MSNSLARFLTASLLLILCNVMAGALTNENLLTDNDSVQRPDTLKLLCVGNSYTSDEMSYLPYVLEQLCPEMHVRIGHLISGSASVSEWWVQRNSAKIIGTPVYSSGPRHRYNPEGGFLWTGTRYVEWTSSSRTWSNALIDSVSLTQALTTESWDYVTFQQVSELVRDYSSISTPLSNLTNYVREKLPGVKIGWIFTHVWNDRYSAENNIGDSDTLWGIAIDVVRQIVDSNLVDFVIPNGTAIQNLRHTQAKSLGEYYSTEYPYPGLSADGSHLHEGLGCLGASMCAAAVFTNRHPNVLIEYDESWNVYGTNFTDKDNPVPIGMTPELENTAYRCAWAAVQSPYEITDISNIPGDADGSGIVDVDDVNAVINIILGKIQASDYGGAADVDCSGIVDVDDVNATINIILQS